MKSFAKILSAILCLAAAIACAACSSGGGSASEAPEPSKEMYALHLDITYENNLIFAKYDVGVKVDNATIATISQGGEVHQEESLEKGSHVISFCKQGDESVVSSSEIQLNEEAFYECSLKAHESEITINDMKIEDASGREARLAEEKAAAERKEAEEQAAKEKEEADRKAADEEKAKQDAEKAEIKKKLEECKGKSAKEATDIARENGVEPKFKDSEDEDITEDVLDENLESVAKSVKVSDVEVSDFLGMHVEFTIKGRFALTADNNKDFAKLLAVKDPADPIVPKFAKKYAGKTIEFDGCIQNLMNHDGYSTRYDLLIGSGDYDPDSASGPNFQYRDEAITSLKWKGKEPDTVSTGMNLHFVAKVNEYEEKSQLFILDPVLLKVR